MVKLSLDKLEGKNYYITLNADDNENQYKGTHTKCLIFILRFKSLYHNSIKKTHD